MREAGRCGIEEKILVWVAVVGEAATSGHTVVGVPGASGVLGPFGSVFCVDWGVWMRREDDPSVVEFDSSRAQAMEAWNLGSV